MKVTFREDVHDTASGKNFLRGRSYDLADVPTNLLEMLRRERLIIEEKPATVAASTPK